MTSIQSLGVCLSISISISAILLAAISRPLGGFVVKVCPDRESIGFWLRFTQVMLVLAPLFFAVTFGLPPSSSMKTLEAGQIIQRSVTSTLIGAFLAMLVTGLWVSSMARRTMQSAPQNTSRQSPISD